MRVFRIGLPKPLPQMLLFMLVLSVLLINLYINRLCAYLNTFCQMKTVIMFKANLMIYTLQLLTRKLHRLLNHFQAQIIVECHCFLAILPTPSVSLDRANLFHHSPAFQLPFTLPASWHWGIQNAWAIVNSNFSAH